MPSPRETKAENERIEGDRRRLRIAEMMLRGQVCRTEMAAAFGVTPQTISIDIATIREQWLNETREEMTSKADQRIRQIQAIAALSLESYERSRKDEIEIVTAEKPCDNPQCVHGLVKYKLNDKELNRECDRCLGTSVVTVTTRKVRGQAGDSSFLRVAKDCFVECARLEGLYPKDTHISGVLRKTAQAILPDGTIKQAIEEQFFQVPADLVVEARATLERIRSLAPPTEVPATDGPSTAA